MITKQKKVELIEKAVEKIKKSDALLFVDFTGLKVADISNLRNIFRSQGIEMMVTKKTLIQRAVNESGIKDCNVFQFPSSIAMVFSPENGPVVSKEAYNFSKKQENLKILGGVFDGNFVNAEQVISLAKLPSREVLLGQLISVLNGNTRKLVVALSEIIKVKA